MNTNALTAPSTVLATKCAALIAGPVFGILKGVDEDNPALVLMSIGILIVLAAITLVIGVRRARQANTRNITVGDHAEALALKARLQAIDPTAHITVNGQ